MIEKRRRTLALDLGRARIGMAISDERKIIASPLETISAGKTCELSVQVIAKEIAKMEGQGYFIDEVVVGLPLKMSGDSGTMAEEAKKFAALLKLAVPCAVVVWDERLTTVQAERSMREGNMRRKKRAKSIDSVTAVIILQSYLDTKSNSFFP